MKIVSPTYIDLTCFPDYGPHFLRKFPQILLCKLFAKYLVLICFKLYFDFQL